MGDDRDKKGDRRGERRQERKEEDEDLQYLGPQRRTSDAHIEVLKDRMSRVHEDIRDLREDLTKYVLRVEILPLKLVVFGGVGFILLGVIAALLLTILKGG